MTDESTFSKNPAAETFVRRMQMESARKARLGDAGTFSQAANPVQDASDSIVEGFRKLNALTGDKTRTIVQKHDAARTVTNGMLRVLERAERELKAHAARAEDEAWTAVASKFDLAKINGKTVDLICGWIKDEARTEGGLAKIRQRVNADSDVASSLMFSKGFTLGIEEAAFESLMDGAYKKHVPDAVAKFERAEQLRKWADNYPGVRRDLEASCYNKALADQVSSRVDV